MTHQPIDNTHLDYIEFEGLHFREDTPATVAAAIAHAYKRKLRIRIHQGDIKTGRLWLEEHDVMGRVGRSTGKIKVPLLIHSARSYGGMEISTNCILGIQATNGGAWLYRAENLRFPEMRIKPCPYPDKPEYVAGVYIQPNGDRYVSGGLQAAFKSLKAAHNYVAFMRGERMRIN